MPIQKTDAILLKKRDLRETSLMLTFFTRDFGKLQGVLKGARGSRARSNIKSLFFSLDQVIFYEKKGRDFFTISQCETQIFFFNILKDWGRASAGYYILELVDVFTEPGEKIEAIFEGILNSFIALDSGKEPPSIARLFEVKFLMELGLWPGNEGRNLSKGAVSTLSRFEKDAWQVSSKIKMTHEIGIELKALTRKVISDNLDRPLRTLKIFNSSI